MTYHHSITSDLQLNHYPQRKVISSLLCLALKNNYAVSVWKLPMQPEFQLVIDTGTNPGTGKVDLEETTSGFLVAPFHNPERTKDTFLKADLYYSSQSNELMTSGTLSSQQVENYLEQLQTLLGEKNEPLDFYKLSNNYSSTSPESYIKSVQDALDSLRHGGLQKVVPAAVRKVELDSNYNSLTSFERLCESYPLAFVSLVSTPKLGTWIGTSPEAIIEVDRNNIFSTVAVAGTQPFEQQTSVQEVAWRQKEIEEQALVSRYIINCFKKIRLREFEEWGPKTVVAGNLLHLKTTFTVDMEETNFPQLGSVMLDLLHPTSAVCGMPKPAAQAFLEKHENFDRELFSGYLGPVKLNGETHLFVNLRCMQVLDDGALLYAGAGVTEDSIPEKEWIETQLKCDTLLDVLYP